MAELHFQKKTLNHDIFNSHKLIIQVFPNWQFFPNPNGTGKLWWQPNTLPHRLSTWERHYSPLVIQMTQQESWKSVLCIIPSINVRYHESQQALNFSATARKNGVIHITLMRRFTGKTVSNHDATTEDRQALDIAQEGVLFGHIQRVNRGLSPTLALVRKFSRKETTYIWRRFTCVILSAEYVILWPSMYVHVHAPLT